MMRQRLLELCADVAPLADDAVAAVVEEIRSEEDEPLRLAVVGKVKAGKSTLVNALIGRRVAATSDAECTRIVTWYRYGAPEAAELVLLDGSVVPIGFGGSLPDELGLPAEQVSHAVVTLQEAALQHYTLIDTPGLGTTTTSNAEATRRAILSDEAAGQADALIYVFHTVDRAADIEFIDSFRAAGGDPERPVTSIGVLSNADRFPPGPWADTDPFEVAGGVARDIAAEHAHRVGTVIPVAAKLAETALTGRVREADAAELAKLAELDEIDVQDLQDEDSDAWERLSPVFDDYVLRHGRELARQGAVPLRRWMLERSGVPALARALRERYVGFDAQLRTERSLTAIERAARDADERDAIVEAVRDARLHPAMHPLFELETWERIRDDETAAALTAQLERILTGADDRERVGLAREAGADEVHDRARELAGEAQAGAAVAPHPSHASANRVLARSYQLIATRYRK